MRYKNPVIPGFYPDPSVVRAGEDYYLVNSSFEFFPGVPLFHSRDLVNWTQIGHVLTRESQLALKACRVSGGIYAPTIRFHGGRFYMVTTNVTSGGNFYVWTDDIRGEWSDPIHVQQGGIDPSLLFDEDGTVYFSSTFQDAQGRSCIGQCVIDIETGKMRTETRAIWHGTGGKNPEGPHLYKRNGDYYLMIAEGGTEYGHMETLARSRSAWGPFEPCPHNPILSHRDVSPRESEFQGLGHAELVETPAGDWWILFHGIRPSQFMLHHMGRETMAAPVTWDADGWPVVNAGRPITPDMEGPGEAAVEVDARAEATAGLSPAAAGASGGSASAAASAGTSAASAGTILAPDSSPVAYAPSAALARSFRDDFDAPALNPRWAYLRNPDMARYSLTKRPGWLALTTGPETLDDIASPTFLGVRQGDFEADVRAKMAFQPTAEDGEAGLTVFHTNEHHYDLGITRRDGKRVAVLRKRVGDLLVTSAPVELAQEGPVTLRVRASRLEYHFFACAEDGEEGVLVGSGRTQWLSTECMVCTFTGCFFGVYAQGSGEAFVDSVEVEAKG